MDDMLVMASEASLINSLFMQVSKLLKLVNLDNAEWFLGMQIIRHENSLILSQKQYINQALKKYNKNRIGSSKTPFILN